MFRSMLRAELRRTDPELEPRLRRRASTWLQRHGDLDGAITQAVAAGDAARTGDLLWAGIVGYLGRGANATVQRWVRGFAFEQIAGCAPLALAAAHSFLLTGDVDRARHLRVMADAAKERRRAAREIPSFDAGCSVFDALATTEGASEIVANAARAYDLEPEHGPWRPFACLVLGVGEHLMGNRQRAQGVLDEGVRLGASCAPSIASLCLAQLVMVAIESEDWDAADDLADRAAAVVARATLGASPISALVFAASAATRSHRGRVDEAKQDLRRGADLLAALGDFIPWYGAEARIMLARGALRLADTVRARTLLAEASRLARRTADAVIFQPCFEEAWAEIDTLAESSLTGPSSLTIAELRILRFLPSHRSFREIAERLDVSVNTVKTQAHAIYRKLDAASRSEAVARASSAGLLGT
jgi:LuxR family maltose regulon positive regulatory protein